MSLNRKLFVFKNESVNVLQSFSLLKMEKKLEQSFKLKLKQIKSNYYEKKDVYRFIKLKFKKAIIILLLFLLLFYYGQQKISIDKTLYINFPLFVSCL